MGKIEETRLISGVWYRLTLPLGKTFQACCIIEQRPGGTMSYFEFEDESRKGVDDILPYLTDITAIDPPSGVLYRLEDFLDDEEPEADELP